MKTLSNEILLSLLFVFMSSQLVAQVTDTELKDRFESISISCEKKGLAEPCKDSALRSERTKNKLGRIIERTEYAEYEERNNKRVYRNPDYYRQRQRSLNANSGHSNGISILTKR